MPCESKKVKLTKRFQQSILMHSYTFDIITPNL